MFLHCTYFKKQGVEFVHFNMESPAARPVSMEADTPEILHDNHIHTLSHEGEAVPNIDVNLQTISRLLDQKLSPIHMAGLVIN